MRKIFLLVFGFLILLQTADAQSYKSLKDDFSVNFYEVCKIAEAHFDTIDKAAKGSGWKGYQRWKNANEYKYFPSGDRATVDPRFAEKQYLNFVLKNTQNQKAPSEPWLELGPYSVDEISRHYSAGIGRVEDFYVNPSNENILYLGSRSGGFWSTNDGGTTWSGGSTDFLPASGVNAITASPTNSDSVLINIRNSGNGYSHGLYRSIDGGTTWAETNFNPTVLGLGGLGSTFTIYKIAYHPTVPNLIFIGTNRGLYRSEDNLATWDLLISSSDPNQIKFHPTNASIVYLYDNRGGFRDHILYSLDTGKTYTASANVTTNGGVSAEIDVSADCPSCVYFASSNGVAKSIDNGQTFAYVGDPTVGTGAYAVNDADTSFMFTGAIDAFTSTDGGKTFQQTSYWSLGSTEHGAGDYNTRFGASNNYIHADLRCAQSVNGNFYVGTDGYLCKSEDNGQTWSYLSQGTAIRENYNLGTSQSNYYITLLGSQDNGTTLKREDGWLEVYGADGMEMLIHPLNPNWMINSIQYGGRYRSTNGGQSISGSSPAGASGSGNAYWIAPLAYDPNEHHTVYHFSKEIYKSTDYAESWTQIGTPNGFSGAITQAVIAENNTDIMLIASSDKLEKSVDGGLTFVDIKGTLPGRFIEDIAFHPLNDNVFAVVYSNYHNDGKKVYITQDGGSTWQNITHNLGDMPLRSVVIDHTPEANIYVGAEIGVFTMPLNGTAWELYNTGLPNCNIREMEINWGANTIKAATWGRGLWEVPLVNRVNYPKIVETLIDDAPSFDLPKEGVREYVTSTIEYAGILSSVYVKYSVGAPSFDNSIVMNNTSGDTWEAETHLPLANEGEKVYFKVFAVGENNDTSETYKFMYTVRTFVFCSGSGSAGTTANYITQVDLNGFSNTSAKEGYLFHTADTIVLNEGGNYDLQVELNYAFSADTCSAWIDYNHNANFDADEIIIMGQYQSNISVGNFTVPTIPSPVSDTVRIRIRDAYFGDPEPCGQDAGEVEDYVVIINKCASPVTKISAEACDRYVWGSNGVEYTTSGIYLDTLQNAAMCDSIVELSLTINNSFADTLVVEACDSYTWAVNGIKYTGTGEYQKILTTAAGCDSIYVLNLTINPSVSVTQTHTACFEFLWDVNGKVYTTSGSYKDTLQTAQGCDSVITLDLTIEQVDVGVSQNSNVLTANDSGLQYQWLDCTKGMVEITGATNQSYIADKNGMYAVAITDGNCTDTSACYTVTGIGINENSLDDVLLIYPNPTSGKFTVAFNQAQDFVEIQIINSLGKQVLLDSQTQINELNYQVQLVPGKYFILLKTSSGEGIKEIIIQ